MAESLNGLWETERYDWSKLHACGSAEGVPEAICRLASSSSIEEANQWYWRIDNVVCVQGKLYEAAIPAASCIVLALPFASPFGRSRMLEYLSQVINGYWTNDELDKVSLSLPALCEESVLRGAWYYLAALPYSSEDEREWCIDLLTFSAKHKPELRETIKWYLKRVRPHSSQPLQEFADEAINRIELMN